MLGKNRKEFEVKDQVGFNDILIPILVVSL